MTSQNQKLYTLVAVGFILLAIVTSSLSLTGFVIAETVGKTRLLSLTLLVAGIASFILGTLKEKGLE
tara:strand:+ start:10351 stop:10551 length:201 start_codon:yes stop_codon:yes gene_type:complete